MAGVQIPTLRENPIAGEAPAPHLSDNVPNAEGEMKETQAAFGEVANSAIRLAQKEEHDTAFMEGKKAANDMTTLHNSLIYGAKDATGQFQPGIKYKDGDPTDLYQDYDTKMAAGMAKYQDNPDYSPYTQRVVNKLLSNKVNQLQQNRTQEQGYQQAKYDKNINDANITLEQDGMIPSSTFVKAGDEGSLGAIQNNIHNIQQNHLTFGAKMGNVAPTQDGTPGKDGMFMDDENGKPIPVSVSPTVKAAMFKDIGDGLHNSIKNLIDSGTPQNIAAAKYMQDQYGTYLSSSSKTDLGEKLHNAEIKNEALVASAAIRRAGNDADKVNKILGGLSQEARLKTLGDSVEDASRMDTLQRLRDKGNVSAVGNDILRQKQSGVPYPGINSVLANPANQEAWNNIKDPKMKQALSSMVGDRPKSTDSGDLTNVQNFFSGQAKDPHDPTKMLDPMKTDPATWAIISKDLGKDEFQRQNARYESIRFDTTGQRGAQVKMMDKAVQDMAHDTKLVTPITGNLGNEVGYSPDDKTKLNLLREKAHAWLDSQGMRNISQGELDKKAMEIVTGKQKEVATSPPLSSPVYDTYFKFDGGALPKEVPAPSKGAPEKSRADWYKQYMDEHKGEKPPSGALYPWIASKQAK